MREIKFQYTPVLNDYVRATLRQLLRMRFFTLLLIPAGMFVCMIFTVILQVFSGKNSSPLDLSAILPVILFLSFIYLLIPALTMWQLRQNFNKNIALRSLANGVANDSGIKIATAYFEGYQDWSLYSDVVESGKYFYAILKSTNQICQIIPHRAFSSEEDLAAFRQLIADKKKNEVLVVQKKSPIVKFLIVTFIVCVVIFLACMVVYAFLALARSSR